MHQHTEIQNHQKKNFLQWIIIDIDEAPVFLSSNAASFQDHKTGKPMGNIDFKFHGGKIDLKSTEIDYLVLRNHVAHFKGSGNLKGTGDVAFFVSLVDGKVLGFRTDYFRMKIWDKASGAVIYDNEPGASLPSEASQALGNGSIVFHLEKAFDGTGQIMNFYPNPYVDAVQLQVDGLADEVIYMSIFDENSNLLIETSRDLKVGNNEMLLDLHALQLTTGEMLIVRCSSVSLGTFYIKLMKE